MPTADDALSIARLGWGAALLARPRAVSGLAEGHPAGEKMATVAMSGEVVVITGASAK